MRWRFSRRRLRYARGSVVPAKAGTQARGIAGATGDALFVLALVAIVASRVSARRPSNFFCLAKRSHQVHAVGLCSLRAAMLCKGQKATPVAASLARLQRARATCGARRILRGGGADGPSPAFAGVGHQPTARCALPGTGFPPTRE